MTASKKKILGIPYKTGTTGPPTGQKPHPFLEWMVRIFGTGLGSGYVPVAQGTVSSFLFLLLWVLFGVESTSHQLFVIISLVLIGIPLSHWGERMWGSDPGRITIDEFAGMAVALWGVPLQWHWIALAFLLFRLHDAFKTSFIRNTVEPLPYGFGVVLDDVVAGFYARVELFLIMFLFDAL